MSYLKLLLIRHAQSLGNQLGCMEGQTSTALSKLGQRQAEQLGQYLWAEGQKKSGHPTPPSHCYSSPLLRATETAEWLQAPWQRDDGDFTITIDPTLQELHQGIFQGLTWSEAVDQYPELCHRLTHQRTYLPIPQAETLEAAWQRAGGWLQEFLANHAVGDTVWVISHGGLMQSLIARILGCDRTWQLSINPTALFEFWLGATAWERTDPNRWNPEYWKIKRFNQTPHLPV